MKEKTIEWKCNSCGAVYENKESGGECPLCGSDKMQTRIDEELEEIEGILIQKGKQKYVSRYKKGRTVLKRKGK